MNIDIKKTDGEESVVIRYKELTPTINRIITLLNDDGGRLTGRVDDKTVFVDKADILYVETVDDKTFAYTLDRVIRLEGSLGATLESLNDISFFRCSKSMIINIDMISELKSMSSNRIDATLKSGEHIIISRRYAVDFRKILKRGRNNEE